MRLVLAFCTALAATPVWADIDERWVRDGADSVFSLDGLAATIGFQPFRRSIAVVIGVGDYTNGWSRLEAPHHDAVRMRDFLKGQGAFDIVYTLTDGAATRERIRRLMVEELPNEVGPDDRVLFYFSGHGTQRELFGDRVVGYLVLQNSAKQGYASMIEMGDIERWWLNLAVARQSLFILDACFSGLGLQSKGDPLYERTIEDLSKRGHHLITAGTANQQSYASLSKWGGSLFTTALIDGMKGRADSANADAPKDGIVSLKEMWDYVEKRIRAEVPSGDMTPQSAGFEVTSDGEFFFLADPDALKTLGGDGEEEAKGDVASLSIDPREMQLWNDVKDSGDAGLLQHFLASYPESVFAPLAEGRLADLSSSKESDELIPPEELFARGAIASLRDDAKYTALKLSSERFKDGLEALKQDNTANAVRSFKLAIAADETHAPAIYFLALLQASGRVSGSQNLSESFRLLSLCEEDVCNDLRDQLLSTGSAFDISSEQLKELAGVMSDVVARD